MTIAEYKKYKANKKIWYKPPWIKKFWDTNPTWEQENLASKARLAALCVGAIWGLIFGFWFGLLI